MQTDAELVKAVLNGNINMYEALVKRYERPVRALAISILREYHLASDASQDAFIKAFEYPTVLPSEPEKGQRLESVAVSSESPYWGGEESVEIAKKWFFEQFGVTFTEEIRPMPVYVVRKR